MTTDNRTNEPTAEQVVTKALKAVEKNIGPRGIYDSWAAEARAVVSTLRVHGLLSEGAPSEEQAYLVTIKLPPNPDHNPRAKLTDSCAVSENCTDSTGEHHTYLALSIDEVQQESRHITRIETVDLAAAGVAPQAHANLVATSPEPVKNGGDSLHVAPPTDPEKLIAEIESRRAFYSDQYEEGSEIDLMFKAADALTAPLDPKKVAERMESYYDRWSGPGEESPTYRDFADDLCEAYKEGKLNG